MALAELVRADGATDIHASTPPRPEITLVFHAGQPLPEDDVHDPTKPDDDAREPVDDTAENEPDRRDHTRHGDRCNETPAETAARIRRGLFGALGVTDEHGVRLQDGTKRIVLCDHEPAAPSGPNPTAAEDPTPPRHLVPDLLARLACANGGLACGEGGDVGRVVGADVQFDD